MLSRQIRFLWEGARCTGACSKGGSLENTAAILFQTPLWGTRGRCCWGEREPQQHDGKHNPPCNVHAEWKPSHTARMPQQSRFPRSQHLQQSWELMLPTRLGKTRPFYSPKPERFASPGRRLDLFSPCYEVISESHLFPSWGCLTTPRVATAAKSRRGGSGAATAVNPEPWAGKRGAFSAKPHL